MCYFFMQIGSERVTNLKNFLFIKTVFYNNVSVLLTRYFGLNSVICSEVLSVSSSRLT